MHNYQMPNGHSTEQKELVVLNINITKCLSNSYSSDLKHKVEIARSKIIQVKFSAKWLVFPDPVTIFM